GSWRACRCSREGRAPPWSMTTRRRRLPGPPPPRGRSGRFGLLPPLAMADTSVEAPQFRPYAELLSQDTREHPALCGAVEARQVTARVGAAPRLLPAGHENAFSGREAEQIALRLLLGHHRVLVVRVAERKLLVRRHTAVLRAGQRGVRTTLAVGEDRAATAGVVLPTFAVAAAEGRVGLGLRELGVALDVDLPAGKARGEAGVHALLADRERELVVGDDDGRFLRVVVEIHLADARGRQRLRDEARRLRIPRDDVDLLAAQLGHDHTHA